MSLWSRGGRVSSRSIGHYDDDGDYQYDARREAYKKALSERNRNTASSYYRDNDRYSYNNGYSNNNGYSYGKSSRGRYHTIVVIEHRSGCTGQSVADDLREAIKYNFPGKVRVHEIKAGRFSSFEVFINGKLLYSKISQGGYPYEDEVLNAVDKAIHGEEFHELERGSSVCNIL